MDAIRLAARVKRFVALSRLPHVLLDVATPAMAALLWLGYFPSATIVLGGLITAFAGYTAVYALNDLVDRRIDREKMDADDRSHSTYLDAIGGRHPVATGELSTKAALAWIGVWGAIGTIGAFYLRPLCMVIFLSGGALEAIYCVLYRVTPLRTIVSGVIKTLGAVAAVLVVAPHPQVGRLAILIAMVFFWEIGGQNIPADWTDIDEDERMNARTIPVQLGAAWATVVVTVCLVAAMALCVALLVLFRRPNEPFYIAAAVAAGAALLVYPAVLLLLRQERSRAQAVFNSASYYPLALLAIVTVRAIV